MIKRPLNAGYIYPYPVSSANKAEIEGQIIQWPEEKGQGQTMMTALHR
jgi:hypothetical protein